MLYINTWLRVHHIYWGAFFFGGFDSPALSTPCFGLALAILCDAYCCWDRWVMGMVGYMVLVVWFMWWYGHAIASVMHGRGGRVYRGMGVYIV